MPETFHSVSACQLENIKTGALIMYGEDDNFTNTGTQQLLDGIKGSKKMVSKLPAHVPIEKSGKPGTMCFLFGDARGEVENERR